VLAVRAMSTSLRYPLLCGPYQLAVVAVVAAAVETLASSSSRKCGGGGGRVGAVRSTRVVAAARDANANLTEDNLRPIDRNAIYAHVCAFVCVCARAA